MIGSYSLYRKFIVYNIEVKKLKYYCVLCVLFMCRDCIVIEYIGYEVELMIDVRK